MARIKYYDPGTNEWKYADSNLVVDNPDTGSGGNVDVTIDGETLVIAENSTATIENETLIL